MEYSIWLSWSTSNECIKITVWRPLWNWPLWTMLKNGNFLQCYSYLFFYYPKNAGCFIGNELTSVSAVNLGALSDLLKNRGPKVHININEKLFQVFFFFFMFSICFSLQSPAVLLYFHEHSQWQVPKERKTPVTLNKPCLKSPPLLQSLTGGPDTGEWAQCYKW